MHYIMCRKRFNMKNTIKAILLLLALTLALGAFAACGGAGAEDVVIASKGSAISSLLLYFKRCHFLRKSIE